MHLERYILRWRYGHDPEVGWMVRGILPDGRIYGEILINGSSERTVTNFENQVSTEDNVDIHRLLKNLRDQCQQGNMIEDYGNAGLAYGMPADPEWLFMSQLDGEAGDGAPGIFMKIVELLKPYIEKSMPA